MARYLKPVEIPPAGSKIGSCFYRHEPVWFISHMFPLVSQDLGGDAQFTSPILRRFRQAIRRNRLAHLRNTLNIILSSLCCDAANWTKIESTNMDDVLIRPQYLRTREAASILDMSPRTLEKLRVIGGGPPYFKRGRLCLYTVADLTAWVEVGRRTSTSDPGGENSA